MNDILTRLLCDIGFSSPLADLIKLHGDASARSYYRLRLKDGQSFIVMKLPEGAASVSEEITNFQGKKDELPFINIARFLASCGLPVPTIHVYSPADHIMLLEDLGEVMMIKALEQGPSAQRDWYLKAVDLLVELQQKTTGQSPDQCIALQRSFDATLLNWEFDHFLEYGLQKRGIDVSAVDRGIFDRETRAITEKIAALPFGFTHRDFQSKNLMARDGKLVLIDFQDALLGPAVYDLVALTRDSYVVLSKELLDECLARFAENTGRTINDVVEQHCLVTVQRKLKDSGRFVFIDQVKKNPKFLPFIPASLGYVKDALAKLPEHRALYDMLLKYLPEWR
ncbi:MAG: phosphotransferase [Deltaproteobacteria bacterium]|nr:phosphotransferase [Deltaproteobacteria bacterium]